MALNAYTCTSAPDNNTRPKLERLSQGMYLSGTAISCIHDTSNQEMYSQTLIGAAKSESSLASTSTALEDDDRASKHNHQQEMDKMAHLRFQAAMVQALTSGDNKTVNSLADQYKSCNGALHVRSDRTLP